ncbi:MAG: phosphoribosyltransferase [Nitrospira sp.]|nr:phosphoribosyltransferase [Nitrospira sp.]
MLFRDRRHAGVLLANRLQAYRGDRHMIVLALPRGGVVVGHELSTALHLPLDVFITRKIAAPDSPDYAVGAVSETGAIYLSRDAVRAMQLSLEDLDGLITAQRRDIDRRRLFYREGRGLPQLHHRTVLLVDDGAATGATVLATLDALAALNPLRIVVALPVAPPSTAERIRALVDECVILSTLKPFGAVGDFFEEFDRVTDDDVLRALHQASEAFVGDSTVRRIRSAMPPPKEV